VKTKSGRAPLQNRETKNNYNHTAAKMARHPRLSPASSTSTMPPAQVEDVIQQRKKRRFDHMSISAIYNFHCIIVLHNLVSSIMISIWLLGYTSTDTEYKIETLFFFTKWGVEIMYYDFQWDSWDLWFHHLGWLYGVMYFVIDPTFPWTASLLKMNSIHIPLFFCWLKRICIKDSPTYKFAANCHLLLWPVIVLFRCYVLAQFCMTSDTFYIGKVICISFPTLDLAWTPWDGYRKAFASLRSRSDKEKKTE